MFESKIELHENSVDFPMYICKFSNFFDFFGGGVIFHINSRINGSEQQPKKDRGGWGESGTKFFF